MLAHSIPGGMFGPAQMLHGSTYVIDVAFLRDTLSEHGIVVDIGRARDVLSRALEPLRYANLDADPAFAGARTTTEYLCRYVFDRIAEAVAKGELGPGSEGLQRMKVTLNESHVARAWYEAAL